ncbi:MAG: ParB N-terminal domain-containing protein, partial [Scytonema sp. CRU_2_7]|nr:ParB N-terminal domain-containing protein [Scytonema sp. CRU_2_7]
NGRDCRNIAEAITMDAVFPPILVFYDGKNYWLADGFHRLHATKKAGRQEIAVEIHQGSRRDALLYSVGANANHGLRRTNADKRRAVEIMLYDEEWSHWSNREIAKRCGVSEFMVRQIRESICDKNADTKNALYNAKEKLIHLTPLTLARE